MSYGNTTSNVDRDRQTEAGLNDFGSSEIGATTRNDRDIQQTGFQPSTGLGGHEISQTGFQSNAGQTGFQPNVGLGDREIRQTGFQDTTSGSGRAGFTGGGSDHHGSSGIGGTDSYASETIGRGNAGGNTGTGYGGTDSSIDAGSDNRRGRDTAGIDVGSDTRPGRDSAGIDVGSGRSAGNTGFDSSNRGVGHTGHDSSHHGVGGTNIGSTDRHGESAAVSNTYGTPKSDRTHEHGDTHKSNTGPSVSDKIKGSLEKTAGKIAGNADMQARGEERKAQGSTY